jgi:thioredoxin 1
MINITDDSFTADIMSQELILVDFWAAWCGPCKTMLPILQEIENDGTLLVGKLNVDENTVKPSEFAVQAIPTMVLFKNGQPVHTMVGAKPKHVIMKEIEPWI